MSQRLIYVMCLAVLILMCWLAPPPTPPTPPAPPELVAIERPLTTHIVRPFPCIFDDGLSGCVYDDSRLRKVGRNGYKPYGATK